MTQKFLSSATGLLMLLAGMALVFLALPATVSRAADAPGAAAAKPVLRMIAGRSAPFKDTQGNTWDAESGFEGGETINRPNLKVTGTTEPGLYESEHYSMASWSYKLANGDYVLKLFFSEDYEGVTSPEGRLFSYAVKDGTAKDGKVLKEVKDFSPWKAAKAQYAAYVESIPVTITNGQVSIVFTPGVENPQINAIEIDPAQVP
jgi:hypothetical protein